MVDEVLVQRPEFVRDVETSAYGVIEKPLTAWERLYNLGAVRKGAILVVLALAWQVYSSALGNPLLFPTFGATLQAFWENLLNGILLMDEPFAALDALTRQKMQDELLTLWEGTRFTVLFVTHSIPEAIKIGSRILLMSPHPGQVKAEINSVPRGQENSDEAAALGRKIHDMLFADQIEERPHA